MGGPPSNARRASATASSSVGRTPDVINSWNRVRDLVVANGRDPSSFGGEAVVFSTSGPERAPQNTRRRWREAGGTHASVSTMNLGFTEAGQHLEYAAKVKAALGG